MQSVKNVLVYIFGVFTFSVFCYCFYEGFITKITLVSWFLLFVSYLLKVFRFDTGILRDSCAVLSLKTLSRLPQSVAFMPDFVSHVCLQYFPFRAFVTMICWTSTEVLLNLVAPLDSAVISLDFEQTDIFWTSGFDSVSILFDSVSAEGSLNCIFFIRFRRSFIWPWLNQYMAYCFDSISHGYFPAMVCSISAEGSLNLVAH